MMKIQMGPLNTNMTVPNVTRPIVSQPIAPIPDLALSQIPKMICQTHITCRTLVRRRYDALEPI